jgi:lipoate-protein ligase A
MTELLCYRDGRLDGATNMARDESLLYAGAIPAAVRMYGWSPATLSLGYFQAAADVRELAADVRELPTVRRLTGGGAILHDREVTYCLLLDRAAPAARLAPAELYRLVHTCWRDVLAADGIVTELTPESAPLPSPRSGPFFCFQKAGRTDLRLGEGKLLGSAQRRLPGRVMQHGSLILGRRFASHPGAHLGDPAAERVNGWIDGFLTRLASGIGLHLCTSEWTAAQLADVATRRERYLSDAWNHLR